MKTTSLSLALLFLSVTVSSFTGCGEPEVKSIAEGISPSEIETYETNLKEMEAQAMNDMAEDGE
ncbi:hypothetical protein Poly51_54920 [Rubripirellula tenax]|uniref:Secreted protein n=1 Tax=Rubripirellula tenax TaxID=2528015 RepID=A0A5C6EDM3_9BACT|nr:hypothetical protein [Rubripirellula tenax]TWU46097.1 hypothetical protein Poly51_54920 [Rubripirellula tenax]